MKRKIKALKTKRIIVRIFVPIVSVVFLFASIAFFISYLSIDKFVKDNAKIQLDEAYRDVITQIENHIYDDEDLDLSSYFINKNNNIQIYIFDKDYNEIYIFDNSVYFDNEMVSFLSSLLVNYELDEDILTNITFKGKKYIANNYIVDDLHNNIKGKYFVVVVELTDKAILLKESMKQLLLIEIIALVFIVLIIFFIAKDLSKPLIQLSNESNNFSVGKHITISKNQFNITELEILRKVLFDMQNRINKDISYKNTIYENVAHDLRTPLVSILGYADSLKSGLIKDIKKATTIILNNGNQLKEMIENILMLTRFDNETFSLNIEEVDIVALIQNQIDIIKIINDRITVLFINDLNVDTIIYSDKNLMVRIIQNLLSNAIKYADSIVKINIGHIKNKIKIFIYNDGLILDKKDINNIFKRYYKGKKGSFGIGLAVVKSSVKYLGGSISVKSNKKEGTVFSVII